MRGLAAIFHFLFACVCTYAQRAQECTPGGAEGTSVNCGSCKAGLLGNASAAKLHSLALI